MSRPWRDKYPIRSLRGDGDDERLEAFFARQSAAMRRRSAPDRDGLRWIVAIVQSSWPWLVGLLAVSAAAWLAVRWWRSRREW